MADSIKAYIEMLLILINPEKYSYDYIKFKINLLKNIHTCSKLSHNKQQLSIRTEIPRNA